MDKVKLVITLHRLLLKSVNDDRSLVFVNFYPESFVLGTIRTFLAHLTCLSCILLLLRVALTRHLRSLALKIFQKLFPFENSALDTARFLSLSEFRCQLLVLHVLLHVGEAALFAFEEDVPVFSLVVFFFLDLFLNGCLILFFLGSNFLINPSVLSLHGLPQFF